MFSLTHGDYGRLCNGLTRRDFLRVGGLGALGLTLPDLLRMEEAGAAAASDKNVILLMLIGAPPQLDTWDPKPNAPESIRGPYKPIKTSVPGIEISEILPKTAKLADRYAILRSLGHGLARDHETGHHVMHTGHFFQAGGMEHPMMGGALSLLYPPRRGMPVNMTLPGRIKRTGTSKPKGQDAGYLGKKHNPLLLNDDPNKAAFKARDLSPDPATGLNQIRLSRRQTLRQQVDRRVSQAGEIAEFATLDNAYQRAFDLIASPEAKAAFDLNREPAKVRDAYGRTTFGQSCLLARRLIERGVRFVSVNMFDTVFNIICWDCHANGGSLPASVADLREKVAPIFDNAYSALLRDLIDRGLYDDTMVLAWGEFGRTPRINPRGGRDHWPDCWSLAMGGGGLKGGQVIGSSDNIGAFPDERPIDPRSCVATVYQNLGINLNTTELPGPADRPMPIVDRGVEPIHELL